MRKVFQDNFSLRRSFRIFNNISVRKDEEIADLFIASVCLFMHGCISVKHFSGFLAHLLGVHFRRQIRCWLEPLHEPREHFPDQGKIGLAKILERNEPWVAKGSHHLGQTSEIAIRHFPHEKNPRDFLFSALRQNALTWSTI